MAHFAATLALAFISIDCGAHTEQSGAEQSRAELRTMQTSGHLIGINLVPFAVQQVAHKNTNEHTDGHNNLCALSFFLPLSPSFSLFASLFLLSATAALFYFYSYAFISFLFADAYTMCLRFLCPTHPSAQTEKETLGQGQGQVGAGDSVQRANGKKAMLKGRE